MICYYNEPSVAAYISKYFSIIFNEIWRVSEFGSRLVMIQDDGCWWKLGDGEAFEIYKIDSTIQQQFFLIISDRLKQPFHWPK